ncbi:MAG: CvpA family protein [Candidatus Marinimicrobia bacterium]|nr:CvpA family protein [Candidatus Neomarinimicrobiota bacterium]MBT4734091.1 CvpA family protein [Candidatus Neomarinimicrobiota bacterium]
MEYFIDGLATFYLVIMGMIGFKRGLIEELGRLFGLVIATLISFKYYLILAGKIHELISIDPWVEMILSASGIFAITIFLVRLLTKFFHIAFLSENNQWVNQFMGVLFGALKGLIVMAVIIWFIDILPLDKWSSIIINNSRIAKTNIIIRDGIIETFHWQDPIKKSEKYIQNISSGMTI